MPLKIPRLDSLLTFCGSVPIFMHLFRFGPHYKMENFWFGPFGKIFRRRPRGGGQKEKREALRSRHYGPRTEELFAPRASSCCKEFITSNFLLYQRRWSWIQGIDFSVLKTFKKHFFLPDLLLGSSKKKNRFKVWLWSIYFFFEFLPNSDLILARNQPTNVGRATPTVATWRRQ